MIVKLLTEHHLRFLSLKRGCRGSSESTLVKMPHCWKSRVTAHLLFDTICSFLIFDTVTEILYQDQDFWNNHRNLNN